MPRKNSLRTSTVSESPITLFLIFLKLGCTSFGGPVAHLAYLHTEFVQQRKWMSDKTYADLVSFCQFLPGPASSQVVIALGFFRCGLMGGLGAWFGFCLPSVILLVLFAQGITSLDTSYSLKIIQGLKIVAVAIVAKALWQMANKLCTTRVLITLMTSSCITILIFSEAYTQVMVIISAGLIGSLFLDSTEKIETKSNETQISGFFISKKYAILIFIFFCLLVAASIFFKSDEAFWLSTFSVFFNSGSIVFGGGHVVLPLLESEIIPRKWLTQDLFMAGYGAAQAVPGPLFTFAAYLGANIPVFTNLWLSGFWCLLCIYLPSFLLVACGLPFWEKLRHNKKVQSSLAAINAAVVGLLLAALYDPVWKGAITSSTDFTLALASFVLLKFWNLPVWLIVLSGGIFYLFL